MDLTGQNKNKVFKDSLTVTLTITAVMWLVKFIEFTLDITLYKLGVYPRAIDGLKGILSAPFVHSDWAHLISNSVPFVLLTTALFYFYRTIASQVLVAIFLLTGISVWIFAARSYHIGASGVVYGLISFLMISGLLRKNKQSTVLALICLAVFSGYFAGIAPTSTQEHVSWESHLFGAITGLISAIIFRKTEVFGIDKYVPDWVNETNESKPIFSNDIFEKSKMERYLYQKAQEEFSEKSNSLPPSGEDLVESRE